MPEKTREETPFTVRENYEKGVAAFKKKNYDYALSLLVAVLKQEPGFFEARKALRACQHARATGRTSFFKKLVGSASTLTRGQVALRSNPLDAIAIAEDVLNEDPSNVGAHELLAQAALRADLPQTAMLSMEIACKQKPGDRGLALLLADAASAAGNPGRAEKVYQELLRADPNNPEIREKLKNVLANRTLDEGGYRDLEGGQGSYRDILRDKEEAVSLEQAARTIKDEDVVERLLRESETKFAKDPQDLRVLREIASLHLQKKDFDQAVAAFERLLAMSTLNDPTVLQSIRDAKLAKFEHLQNSLDPTAPDHEERLAALKAECAAWRLEDAKKRAEMNPTDLYIRYELGELYLQAGRLGEAIAELQRAQNNPNKRIAAMSMLAQAFAKRGMNDLAARKLQDALKEKVGFDEEAKDLHYQLGCVLAATGKKEQAIEEFKIIYEQDIGYRDVMQRVDDYYAGGAAA